MNRQQRRAHEKRERMFARPAPAPASTRRVRTKTPLAELCERAFAEANAVRQLEAEANTYAAQLAREREIIAERNGADYVAPELHGLRANVDTYSTIAKSRAHTAAKMRESAARNAEQVVHLRREIVKALAITKIDEDVANMHTSLADEDLARIAAIKAGDTAELDEAHAAETAEVQRRADGILQLHTEATVKLDRHKLRLSALRRRIEKTRGA